MKKRITLFFLIIVSLSCNKKSKKEDNSNIKNNKEMNINDIKKQIELQKNANFEDFRPENPYKPEEIDVNLLIPIIYEGLKSTGYKFLSNQEFQVKIKNLVKNNKVKENKTFTTIFFNNLDGQCNTLFEHEFDLTNNQFIVNNYNFITPMLFLEDVISIDSNNNYSIKIPQNIIARNKYLFNDSKADLAWLLVNDKDFLKQLVCSLGYDIEPKISKMVLEEDYKVCSELIPIQHERIGELFFTKDCDNIFNIRRGLLDYVRDNTNANDNRFLYALSNYSDNVYSEGLDNVFERNPSKIFNENEKAKIVAIIASIEIPLSEKYKSENPELWNNTGSSLYNIAVSHPEVIDIIKKENYFEIDNLKQIIDLIENEIEAINSK
ncbi:hypothetical protein [Flavobacterium sp.]|uniref:hypothetical protein n=1 Tax=Flavobacterium sp. TaxID=239 RepID=UPI00404865DE